jgi:hypothetical protein
VYRGLCPVAFVNAPRMDAPERLASPAPAGPTQKTRRSLIVAGASACAPSVQTGGRPNWVLQAGLIQVPLPARGLFDSNTARPSGVAGSGPGMAVAQLVNGV